MRHSPRLGPVLAITAVAVVTALLLTLWRQPVWDLFLHRERLIAWVQSMGPAAPLAIIVLQVVQTAVAPIPGQLIGMVSGYLFGPWLGALYSMIGTLLGNLLALLLVRRWGRPFVERLVAPPTLARVDGLACRLGLPLLLAIYLLPFLPDDVITLVAGLASIPLSHIMLAVLLGRLPSALLSAWVGAGVTGLTLHQWAFAGFAVVILLVLGVVYRRPLEQMMWCLVERLSQRRTRE